MVKRGKSDNLLKGAGAMREREGISILQCTGDTLSFGANNVNKVFNFKLLLYCFKAWPGLRINFGNNILFPLSISERVAIIEQQQEQ